MTGGGFIQVPKWARDLDALEIGVYFHLLARARIAKGTPWTTVTVSARALALPLQVRRSRVQEALDGLEDKGVIQTKTPAAGRRPPVFHVRTRYAEDPICGTGGSHKQEDTEDKNGATNPSLRHETEPQKAVCGTGGSHLLDNKIIREDCPDTGSGNQTPESRETPSDSEDTLYPLRNTEEENGDEVELPDNPLDALDAMAKDLAKKKTIS